MKPLVWVVCAAIGLSTAALAAEGPKNPRRILYNLDGDSCLFTRAHSKEPVATTAEDMKRLVTEVTGPGSQVDTLLVCVNAQVMYYPTKVGTLRGTLSTPAERVKWPPSEVVRFETIQRYFDTGVDPYAVIFAEAKLKGLETLLTFRVNDAHGNDFLRTKFWADHPEFRLPRGALDLGHDEVREYVFRLIEEECRRYDCDGLELDFNRFPTFFKDGTTDERVAKINKLVERVRRMLDTLGEQRGRRLVLAARVPSNMNRKTATPETSRALGCDVEAWVRHKWVDFVAVSEFYLERYDLPIRPWKDAIHGVAIYGGIECTEGPGREKYLDAAGYRRAARHLWNDGTDGIYLFNFFTTREHGSHAWEPPFEVLGQIGDPKTIPNP
jgi:hypothetical protein